MTSNCPACGSEPTEESVIYERLSDVGYLHTDTKRECQECGETWITGEPHGEPQESPWICDSCGGDYMPHFLYVNTGERTIETRPKCQVCNHVPEERIELDSKFNGENIRGFVGHHATTGEEGDESVL